MKLPWISRSRSDERVKVYRDGWIAEEERAKREADELRKLLAESQNYVREHWLRIEALQDTILKLKLQGATLPIEQAPADNSLQFGPLTRAALNDMSIGQSGIVKRKMREKATALWLEQRGAESQDEAVAIAVRRGETG